MANKAGATRQKLSFRIEPSQQALKPRKAVAIAANKRAASPKKLEAAGRRVVQRASLNKINKKLTEPDGEH